MVFAVTFTYKGLQGNIVHPPLYNKGCQFFCQGRCKYLITKTHILLCYIKSAHFLLTPVSTL